MVGSSRSDPLCRAGCEIRPAAGRSHKTGASMRTNSRITPKIPHKLQTSSQRNIYFLSNSMFSVLLKLKSIKISRIRSIKGRKQKPTYRRTRRGRRNAKKAAAEAAKAAAGPAKTETDPTTAAHSTPADSKPVDIMSPSPAEISLVRRQRYEYRKLKAGLRKMQKKLEHFERCEKYLARALDELAAARTQIGELNAAMDYLLAQKPHEGKYFDRVSQPNLPFPLLNLPRICTDAVLSNAELANLGILAAVKVRVSCEVRPGRLDGFR
ncbi:hypothetical protein VTK56DRAFT_8855 [Thermocarpiscus australiensis]